MKTAYLLPCSCGNKVRIDAGQAGAKVDCACGKQLTAPTFRALKELEVAAPTPELRAAEALSGKRWSAGRGILFSFGLLLAVVAAAVACYHLLVFYEYRSGGEEYRKIHLAEMEHGVEHMTAVETLAEFKTMSKAGLTVDGIPPWSKATELRDKSLLWVFAAAAGFVIGLLSLFGSLIGVSRPKARSGARE